MKKGKSIAIQEVLWQFLRQEGLETPLYQHRLLSTWQEVLPPAFKPYIKEARISNQTLVVQITSPAVKQELLLQRKKIVQQINEKLGAQVITDIKVG